MQNLYEILGVENHATYEEIKKAYKTLASAYHPDKNQGDGEKMAELNIAYEVLGNEESRIHYDLTGDYNGKPQTKEDVLYAILSNMFINALNEFNPEQIDIIQLMKNHLNEANRINRVSMSNAHQLISRYQKAILRINVKDGVNNIFAYSLTVAIEQQRKAIVQIEERIAQNEIYIQHLDNFSWDIEAKQSFNFLQQLGQAN